MKKFFFNDEFFNIKDTLECGQIFRYYFENNGYYVFSKDKAAFCCNNNGKVELCCEEQDFEYFNNFFDTQRDYKEIYQKAVQEGGLLSISAENGKGIHILNQDIEETIFSFIISQNNNIPRIKMIIERLCCALGNKKTFNNKEFFTFPSAHVIAKQNLSFFKEIGLGYRAEYILSFAKSISNGYLLNYLINLKTPELKQELLKIYGIGPKVADCICLFAFHRSDCFPVDTWIEKVYRENYNGTLKNREQISKFFTNKFKNNSGYFQQYLFHHKRNLEKN